MRVEKKPKAFAYRVPIGDYNHLRCIIISKDYFSIIDNGLLYYTEVFLSLAMKLAGIVT